MERPVHADPINRVNSGTVNLGWAAFSNEFNDEVLFVRLFSANRMMRSLFKSGFRDSAT